jgi:hypothetical protein
MPLAALVPALIGAGSSIAGGLIGASGAKGAAKDQSATGIAVGNSIDKATGGAIEAGYNGLTQANAAMDTGLAGSTGALATGVLAGNAALQQSQDDANYALWGARDTANGVQKGVYDSTLAGLDPYRKAGAQGVTDLASFMAPGGGGTKDFSFQADPGYDFRMAEGAKALERSSAGRVLGGRAAKEMNRYGQDYASNEYGKAFDRFRANRSDQYGMLSGLSKIGLDSEQLAGGAGNHYADAVGGADLATGARTADVMTKTGAGLSDNDMRGGAILASLFSDYGNRKSAYAMQGNQWIGQTGLQGAEAAGNAYMGASNARAAGDIGAANAWAGMFSGLNNTASAVDWSQVFKPKPAPAPGMNTNVGG